MFARDRTLKALEAKRQSLPRCSKCHGYAIEAQHEMPFVSLFSADKVRELILLGTEALDAITQASMNAYLLCPNETRSMKDFGHRWYRANEIPAGYVIS